MSPPPRNDNAPFPAAPGHDFTVRRRTLIALLIAAIVMPCAYVAAMAYSDLRLREADATDTTLRTVRVAEEHALKVFDMNETLDARVVDLVQGLDDEGIRANEAQIHDKLDAIGGGYPQVAAVSIFGGNGDLLASSRFSPPPPVSIVARDDFTGIRDGHVLDHVSRVMVSRVTGETVFNTGVARHDEAGAFSGLVSVALRPDYFSSFYRDLLGAGSPMDMGLVRSDGSILAFYPQLRAGTTAITAASPLRDALARGTESGVIQMHSQLIDQDVILAYRRVGAYPVYVSCGYRTSAIWAGWWRHLSVLIISMFTPSIALWGVIWLSLRRLAAEEEAWERWQAEAAMRRSIESAYRQSRKMEALGNLVGSVAHDFNNLLMIVSANVQVARRRGVPGLERELSAVERALKSGQSLTRQLLGVARKQPLRNETIHVGRWLPACRELLRASLGAKVSLVVVVDVDDDLWPVLVDVAEFELALINLAVNARDAMPNGGRFTVRARNIGFRPGEGFPLDGDFVHVSLEDTGTGMPPEVLARAFEPLYTTKPKGMGTGLGLPQVFAFCERSGGLAAIDSAIGAGTSVHLYLPRALHAPTAQRTPEPRKDDAAQRQGLRVLLVEDNDEVAAGTEALLQMMGHQVTCANDAASALQLLEAGRAAAQAGDESAPHFDLILSDIHMPGEMNGIDLAEAVQSIEPKLPIILVTGYAEELERARHADVRVLSKPFDIGLLEKMLEQIQRDQPARERDATL